MIFLGLDAFSELVLFTLSQSWGSVVPAFKRRLTASLVYRPGDNLWRWAMEEAGSAASESASLERQLIKARNERVCSQSLRAGLEEEGYRVGERLEVYALTEVRGLEQLDFLQEVLNQVEACLRDFEIPLVTTILNMAAYDQPDQTPADRPKVLAALDRWLAKKEPHLPGLERCYVVTREMDSGQAILSGDELVSRTAGFLAAHYLEGPRQPGTEHQYLLFGVREASRVELGGDQGLCETFGQDSLKFDFDQILDWCAHQETRRTLQERFLAPTETGSDRQAWFEKALQNADETLSVTELSGQVIEKVLEEIWPDYRVGGSDSATVSLDDQRQLRRRVQQILSRPGPSFADYAGARMEELGQALAGILDDQLMKESAELARAKELLAVIGASCRAELNEVRRLDRSPAEQPDFIEKVNRSWFYLSQAVMASPSTELFWGRLTLLGLLAGLGLLLGGGAGLGLAGLALLGLVAWNWYARSWLPRQRQQAQQQYGQVLDTWLRAGLVNLVQPEVEKMLADLAARYEEPAGAEWQAVQHWRMTLVNSVERCRTREAARPAGPQSSPDWIILPHVRQAYYRELATRPPERMAEIFLEQLRRSGMDRWRDYTGEQVLEQLIPLCRDYYEPKLGSELLDLEYHLREIEHLKAAQLDQAFKCLVQNSRPLARTQWRYGRVERPHLKLLIVQDPARSVFSDLAKQEEIELVGGAPPGQILCIQTIHHLPVKDLGLANKRLRPPEDE
jgi:hypothetical protein